MTSETRVKMQRIRYEASIWPENGDFVASAWPLNIASVGSSVDHALTMLQEAVSGVLESEAEHGGLETRLEEAGYCLVSGVWTPPEVKYVTGYTSFPHGYTSFDA
jgi:predicted RNase H-like HicB family nuclease